MGKIELSGLVAYLVNAAVCCEPNVVVRSAWMNSMSDFCPCGGVFPGSFYGVSFPYLTLLLFAHFLLLESPSKAKLEAGMALDSLNQCWMLFLHLRGTQEVLRETHQEPPLVLHPVSALFSAPKLVV